jgi:hypothetical protein
LKDIKSVFKQMKEKLGFKYIASTFAKAIVLLIMDGVHWFMMATNSITQSNTKFVLLTVLVVAIHLQVALFMVL